MPSKVRLTTVLAQQRQSAPTVPAEPRFRVSVRKGAVNWMSGPPAISESIGVWAARRMPVAAPERKSSIKKAELDSAQSSVKFRGAAP